MNVLFYSTMKGDIWERLQESIKAVVPSENMEIYRTIAGLSKRLCQPLYDLSIAVLLATTGEELQEILSIQDLITDIRVIAIIPDREKETISKGHLLRPRYLTYADGDFADVAAVLGKMLEIINNNNICRKGGD